MSACGHLLAKQPSEASHDRALALAVTAAISFIVANTLPLMQLRVAGRFASTTIAGGAFQMWLQGQTVTSVLVAFCAVIAPASYLLLMLTILLAARRSPVPQWTGELLRWLRHLRVWSMLEVVLLGILVALIKIAQLATVDPGIGMYAFGAVVVVDSGDHGQLRCSRDLAQGAMGGRTDDPPGAHGHASWARVVRVLPPGCPANEMEPGFCPRCGGKLEGRRPPRSRPPGRSSPPPPSATSPRTFCRY